MPVEITGMIVFALKKSLVAYAGDDSYRLESEANRQLEALLQKKGVSKNDVGIFSFISSRRYEFVEEDFLYDVEDLDRLKETYYILVQDLCFYSPSFEINPTMYELEHNTLYRFCQKYENADDRELAGDDLLLLVCFIDAP